MITAAAGLVSLVLALPPGYVTQLSVTESNAKDVVKKIDDPNTSFILPKNPSEKLMTALAKIPSDRLLSLVEQAPQPATRGFAAQILAFKGDKAGFRAAFQGYLRGDISLDSFESAAKLYKPLALPADFRPEIEDASLHCGVRSNLFDLLAVRPSAESVSLLQEIYNSPEKQRCSDGRRDVLDTKRVIAALGKIGLSEAVPFLKSVPRCVDGARYTYPGKLMPNEDRETAIAALGAIGGEAAGDALVALLTETYSEDEQAKCKDPRQGSFGKVEKFPWRKKAAAALADMKDVRGKQLASALLVAPEDETLQYALLKLGPSAKEDIEKLFDPPSCTALSPFTAFGKVPTDRSFLKGSKAADVVVDLLAGLAARQKTGDQPKSATWDKLRADEPECVKSDGYTGLEADKHSRGLVQLAGEIGDGRAVESLSTIFDGAAAVYAAGDTAGMWNSPAGLVTTAFGMRLTVIDALGRIGTPEAQKKLEAVIKSDAEDSLRDAARKALAESKAGEQAQPAKAAKGDKPKKGKK